MRVRVTDFGVQVDMLYLIKVSCTCLQEVFINNKDTRVSKILILLVYGWHDAHLAAPCVFVTCDTETWGVVAVKDVRARVPQPPGACISRAKMMT